MSDQTQLPLTSETPQYQDSSNQFTPPPEPKKGFWGKVDNWFGITRSGSRFRVEIVAGLTTFMAMVYILMVNAGMFEIVITDSANPYGAAYIATALGAIIGTMLMAFLARMPLAQASGMGINAFIVYTLILGGTGLTYANCMVFTLLDGVIFLLLTATGLRRKIFEAIPAGVRHAIPVGIGLFIAFIGMQQAGIIVNNDSTLTTFVSFNVLGDTGFFTYDAVNKVYGGMLPAIVAILGVFAIAMRNTLLFFTQGYFITQTFNIVLAYFIYKKILLGKFFRFILYMPNMLAGIILVSIYKNLIGAEGPLVTALLDMGVIDQPIMFLNTTKYAIWASLAYSLWPCVGGVFLWCSGAMARIPKDLFEAASLDGITPWKEFIHIVLPMISGTLSTLYIIGISGILGSGGATLYLTFGEYGTTTLSFWIFKQVYTGGGSGTSSALGILMTLVTIPLIFLVKYLAKKVTAEVSY